MHTYMYAEDETTTLQQRIEDVLPRNGTSLHTHTDAEKLKLLGDAFSDWRLSGNLSKAERFNALEQISGVAFVVHSRDGRRNGLVSPLILSIAQLSNTVNLSKTPVDAASRQAIQDFCSREPRLNTFLRMEGNRKLTSVQPEDIQTHWQIRQSVSFYLLARRSLTSFIINEDVAPGVTHTAEWFTFGDSGLRFKLGAHSTVYSEGELLHLKNVWVSFAAFAQPPARKVTVEAVQTSENRLRRLERLKNSSLAVKVRANFALDKLSGEIISYELDQ